MDSHFAFAFLSPSHRQIDGHSFKNWVFDVTTVGDAFHAGGSAHTGPPAKELTWIPCSMELLVGNGM